MADLVSDFGFCFNKEQYGLMWPRPQQRWQIYTKTYFFCSLIGGLDTVLKTLASTLEFLPLSNLAT